ncbi:MAG: ABC transporter substrate-binding protein, partial [Planctomycetota bacterium]|nr:ABC transporter substrate-binding protein [Planctomycetota bacterium]
MKKAWIVIGVLIVIALAIVLTLTQTKEELKEIKIGAILPLTGNNARYGIWIQEALELAKDDINSEGGINGKKLKIIYEDDQADPKLAANAMQKLATVDRVPVVFGSWASSSVLSQAPIAEKTHTVLMGEAISPKIRDAGDYVFRIQPDARYYIRELVPFMCNKTEVRKISIFYVNNDFGSDQAKVFETEFKEAGGQVLSVDAFEQGATDFKTELIKIQSKAPEAIFCPAYAEIAIILKQARELGMKQQFFASVPFENPDILKAAG